MDMKSNRTLFGILVGALLMAGLFFFWPRIREAHLAETRRLRPSDINFSESNKPVVKGTEISTAGTASLQKFESSEKQAPAVTPQNLSGEDKKKFETFEQILSSKNDNDPRMDSELSNLSPQMHQALRDRYQTLAAENRNGRGTVAFLIARDLQSVTDLDFLKSIYQESPCLGFRSCSVADPQDPHFSGVNQTSLEYPQLVTLYQLDRQLDADPSLAKNPEFRKALSDLVREARQFPSAAVQQKANDLSKRL